MKKQLFFVHGGEVFSVQEDFYAFLQQWEIERVPEEHKRWRDDLKITLEENNWEFFAPQMPNKLNADYRAWKIWFEKYIAFCDADEIVFVGYSLGANFLSKYIQENSIPQNTTQLHLVAGCYGWEGQFALSHALQHVEQQVKEIFVYYSEDDPIVPREHYEKYHVGLPKAKTYLFTDRGHFFQEQFPELVDNILGKR